MAATPSSQDWRQWLGAVLALTALAYWPGLAGPFVFDDFANIVLPLRDIAPTWEEVRGYVLSGQSGPLGRPLSLLSFGLNFLASGLSPLAFKATNLAIHLLNACLVFALVNALLRELPQVPRSRYRLVLVGTTALWALHPLHLTSVLYVVQRMTGLSSTFVLLGLLAYLRARRSQQETQRVAASWLVVVVPACLLAATLAKESGVLLLAYVAALEVSLLRFRTRTQGQARALAAFFTVFLVVPLLLVAVFLFARPGYLQADELARGYTLVERVLTEPRVLWFYLQVLMVPVISQLGLYHDDFTLSTSLLYPNSTLPALLGWCLLLLLALLGRNRRPMLAFAVTWFLAGHALESTVVMLQPVQLHRNYLAMLGPVLALVVLASRWSAEASQRGVAALLALGALSLAGVTGVRASQWRSAVEVATFEVVHHPGSPRANYDAARVLAEIALLQHQPALLQEAHRYFRRAAELDRNDISALLALWTTSPEVLPKSDYQALLSRLAQRPLAGPDVGFLRSWLSCRKLTPCVLPPDAVLPVFAAILEHPQLAADLRANVLALLGLYYADDMGDLRACVEVMEHAAREQPADPVYQLNLAQAYLFLPDYDKAETALAAAARLDRLGRERSRLRKLEADLAEFRARSRRGQEGRP